MTWTCWKRQGICLFMAVSFFTRLPAPAGLPFDSTLFRHCSRYFGVVGWLIGLLTTLICWGFSWFLPVDVAIFLSMLGSILLTGAFHEDGLADMADGLVGGMTVERRLEIMKDSRLGTYGAIALVSCLLLKFLTLSHIGTHSLATLCLTLFIVHTLSRSISGTLMFDMQYVRKDDSTAKVKAVAETQDYIDMLVLLGSGLVTLWVMTPSAAGTLLAVNVLVRQWMKRYLLQKLGGYTGDCLGGAQQCCELAGYLVILAWLDHGQPLWTQGVSQWLTHI